MEDGEVVSSLKEDDATLKMAYNHSVEQCEESSLVLTKSDASGHSLEDFVRMNGGDQVIRRVLIANNGNAAVKAIRSLRHWAYETFGNEKEIQFLVMATLDDIEANAEFISEADYYIEVPAGSNNNNYANIQLITQLAEENACDAVWPGWGHASENYKLPLALRSAQRSIIWIGPSPTCMLSLGDKIGSSIIAQSADVPCIPWSGDHVKLDTTSLNAGASFSSLLTPEKLKEAGVNSLHEAFEVCESIGYPVMIKASEGGGGKGIRKCNDVSELETAFRQVCKEVKGSLVFIMQFVPHCRHLEVQILADNHGDVYALGSRDCTLQRRCQKIIEEGPITVAPKQVIQRMEEAAVRMCKLVRYNNAGTCEFLYIPETGNFYFLEVNARLQVEHVVTECLCDINLPAAQLQIAMGISIENIPDIKRHLQRKAIGLTMNKHVIAARITAEHAEESFRPTCGAVNELSFRSSRQVWGYFSIGTIGRVHSYADSQFGHIFSSGNSRENARTSLIMALKGLTVRGEIRTNIEALIRILETQAYIKNDTHTTWLEGSVELNSLISKQNAQHSTLLAVLFAAVYEASTQFTQSQIEFKTKVEQGQLPSNISVQHKVELVHKNVRYCLTCMFSGPHHIIVDLNGSGVEASIRKISHGDNQQLTAEEGGAFLVSGGFDWRTRRVYYKRDNAGCLRVTFDGSTYTFSNESDPSQVRAPVSGKLVRWLASNHTFVVKGQPFAEIEIMKMYMEIRMQESGTISHVLAEGAVFQIGDLLATLEIPEDVAIYKSSIYEGKFDTSDTHSRVSRFQNPLNKFRAAKSKLINLLNGYVSFRSDIDSQMENFFEYLINPQLPIFELTEALAVLDDELPAPLYGRLHAILKTLKNASDDSWALSGDAEYVQNFSDAAEETLPEAVVDTQPINETISSFSSPNNALNSSANDVSKVMDEGASEASMTSWEISGKAHAVRLPVKIIAGAIEAQLYVQSQKGYQGLMVTRNQLEPVFFVLKKYERGMIFAAADQIVDLLYRYLEIEEIFHATTDIAAKTIQSKRTEYDTSKLLLLARSHQNLAEKNRIICRLLEYIKTSPAWQTTSFFQTYLRTYSDFMENLPHFYDALYRISCLSKPEYSTVSFHSRQLLLTRIYKPFSVRVILLQDRLLEYSERRSGGVTPLLGTSVSGSGIGFFVNDLESCGDDCLIALMVHPNVKLRKLALDIFVRRYYDRHGVHEIMFHTEGESWYEDNRGGNSDGGSWLKPSEDYDYCYFRSGGNSACINSGAASNTNAVNGAGSSSTHAQGSTGNSNSSPQLDHSCQLQLQGRASSVSGTASPHIHGIPSSGLSTSTRYSADLHVSADKSEVSAASPSVCGSPDQFEQVSTPLLAVWTHHAVFNKDFLNGVTDDLCPSKDCSPGGVSHLQGGGGGGLTAAGDSLMSPGVGAGGAGGSNMLMEDVQQSKGILASNGSGNAPATLAKASYDTRRSNSMGGMSYSLSSEFEDGDMLVCGSKLHHILRAFGSSSEDVEYGSLGRSQQTVAMAFASLTQLQHRFTKCLQEYHVISRVLPPSPPSADGKILMIFISNVDESESLVKEGNEQSIPDTAAWAFRDLLSQNKYYLYECCFYLVCFCFLVSSSRTNSPAASSFDFNEATDLIFRESNLASSHAPRYLYFRCLKHIGTIEMPSKTMNSAGGRYSDEDALFSGEGGDHNGGSTRIHPLVGGVSGGVPNYPLPSPLNRGLSRSISAHHSSGNYGADSWSSGVTQSISQGVKTSGGLGGIEITTSTSSGNSEDTFSKKGGLAEDGAQLYKECVHEEGGVSQSPMYVKEGLKGSLVGSESQGAMKRRTDLKMRFSDEQPHQMAVPRNSSISSMQHLSSLINPGFEDAYKFTDSTQDGEYCHEPFLQNVHMCHFPLLELKRLKNFYVNVLPTTVPQIHLYEAIPRRENSSKGGSLNPNPRMIKQTSLSSVNAPRFFVRILLHHSPKTSSDEIFSEQERYFVLGLNALEVASLNGFDKMAGNHILMVNVCNITQHSRITPSTTESASRKLAERYEKRLSKNCISIMEFRYVQKASRMSEPCVPIRLVLDNPTGQALRLRKFVEVTNPTTGEQIFSALDNGDSLSLGPRENGTSNISRTSRASDLDGKPVDFPHPLAGPLDLKRAMAARLGTLYIYDFLDLFEEAVKKQWRKCPKFFFRHLDDNAANDDSPRSNLTLLTSQSHSMTPSTAFLPDKVLEAVELSVNSMGNLEEVRRDPGQNDCGMVAWRMSLCTPEFPKGRRIILIGNDITFQAGTFGVQEDLIFQKASEYARKQGIPRVYIAVNSGARMGLAAEVQKLFKVEWIDALNPARGFKYLYLSEGDYKRLKQTDSVVAEAVKHPTEGKVFKISDVIGSQIGLGVENLCGSAAIAGETSRAYRSTLTITFVTGRSVGIGAYLTRLGHRVIQKVGAPILLTGYQALNRVIGRDVYSSNDEIGGIDIMHKNGISHSVVKGDIEGCEAILDWLSYVPEHRDGPLPIMVDPNDPVNRTVAYKPTRATDDPRLMLTGCVSPKGQWLGGIFDLGSFREVMADWAKSVICGRARLGGIPVGVINVETRVTEATHPADPAMPHTSEITLTRAGQVWYPESAYKTAQAIMDFNQEELPLFIFANWRGFSGGQRDMYNEVLKFGSFIVDSLVEYRQPCFVYIPPKAELRGGAWVVVDSRINSEHMEMYADWESRGGVLEPAGMVEIKFRDKALIETATRLDHVLKRLMQEDKKLAEEGMAIDSTKRQEIKESRDKRIAEVLPVYKQVATHFADLHDTPVRMRKKHAINDIVAWEKSRHFFYWRLRRQLILFNLRNEILTCNPTLTLMGAERLVYKWAEDSGHSVESNYQFVQWACHSIQDLSKRLSALHRQYIRQKTASLCGESLKTVVEAVKNYDASALKQLIEGHSIPSSMMPTFNAERSMVALSALTRPHEEE